MAAEADWKRVELWLVALIALHSLAVGAALLVFTDWSVAGRAAGPPPRQPVGGDPPPPKPGRILPA